MASSATVPPSSSTSSPSAASATAWRRRRTAEAKRRAARPAHRSQRGAFHRTASPNGPNSPRRRVTETMAPCHTQNHIPPACAGCRSLPRLLDRSRPARRTGGPICVARSAWSDPHETCGFAAQWAFLRHTHRAGRSRLDSSSWKGESPPSAASCRIRRSASAASFTPRERAAGRPYTASSASTSSARAHRRQGGVADAPPRHGRLRPGRRLRARFAPGNYPTMPDLDPATRTTVRSRRPVRRDSGPAQLVPCREGGSAFRLTRKSEPARSGAAVTLKGLERSGGPAELAEQVDGRGRPCAPGRRGRPALILLPSERPRRRPHRRRGRTGATRRKAVRGRGAEPPPAPMSDIGYAGSRHPDGGSQPFPCAVSGSVSWSPRLR